jgi:hypothetical protein
MGEHGCYMGTRSRVGTGKWLRWHPSYLAGSRAVRLRDLD